MDLAGKHNAGAEAAPRVRVGMSSREASRAWTQAAVWEGISWVQAEAEDSGGAEGISSMAERERAMKIKMK